jgi:hypothetical protein
MDRLRLELDLDGDRVVSTRYVPAPKVVAHV